VLPNFCLVNTITVFCCQLSPFVPSPSHYLWTVLVPGFKFRYVTFIIITICLTQIWNDSLRWPGCPSFSCPECSFSSDLSCVLRPACFIFLRPSCLFHDCDILCTLCVWSCPSTVPCIKNFHTPWPAKCRVLLSVCVCVCVCVCVWVGVWVCYFVSALFCALLNVLFYVLRSLTFCSGPSCFI